MTISSHSTDSDREADEAYEDLVGLVEHGSRFHGTPEIAAAGDWIEARLTGAGLAVERQRVELPGWSPGTVNRLEVLTPVPRSLPAWPMLWSGASGGVRTGRVTPTGPQGLWGDSMTWRKFIVLDDAGTTVAYLHARDDGPAAPQPLPSGSDLSTAHLAIGRIDGLQLSEWIADGKGVEVELDLDSGPVDSPAVSDNLVVDIGGTGPGLVLLCAHYDSFFNTVGAYDNGSGTIALLRLAERWADAPPPVSVRLVFFTAEEWHLGGSRSYVDAATEEHLASIDYVFNLDGLGRGDFLEAFAAPETFETAFRSAVRQHADLARPGLTLVSRFPPPTGTDDAAFYRAGVPSAFLTFNDLHRLHQPDDLPNPEIGANIAWTVGLVQSLVGSLAAPRRVERPGIL
jgi:hypothetical protein